MERHLHSPLDAVTGEIVEGHQLTVVKDVGRSGAFRELEEEESELVGIVLSGLGNVVGGLHAVDESDENLLGRRETGEVDVLGGFH